jgi:pimeloyl-ACP methyl ester carboxylesterase
MIVGDSDRITPPDLAAEIATGIAEARLETIPDCGHHATVEWPQTVAKLLFEWFSA